MKAIKDAKAQAKIVSKTKNIKLKKALDLVAQKAGKPSWKAYRDSLDTFWCSVSLPYLNHWFASYGDARAYLQEKGGYLLTYKGQYLVVQREYIESLGLDPDAKVWKRIEFDVSTSRAQGLIIEYLDGVYG